MPTIALLYAGLLGIMSIAVSFPAGRLRGSTGISVGDGSNQALLLAMRRHGSFTEFVPLALLLLALLEMARAPGLAIHIMGALLVVARICHAVGLKADTVNDPLRGIGAGGTALVTVVMSVWCIVLFF